ncbi:hypothetical protein NP511_14145 [Natrinema thermotolerans]|uniref:Uncharacterized protein n=1 Tax=Natrinema thermotolerans TaxID=121872 RepID=A0AAF0T051_9EURY|nr:hypothetical protein [Natrinema thermotolerans]WMT06525.1 hypothetical protein NP511_14145 [Natrinema thermotolerans]
MEGMSSRRKFLRTVGISGLGLSTSSTALSISAIADMDSEYDACPNGCPDPWERKELDDVDSYTGPQVYGEGDFTITLSSSVIVHEPIWRPSISQWAIDISVSGTTDCRFVDDDSPAEEMWWHECKVSDISIDNIGTKNNENWAGVKIGSGESPADYENLKTVESGIGVAIGALNTHVGVAYGTTQFLMSMLEQFGDTNNVNRKYNVDAPRGGGYQHHTGYYHKYSAEVDSGEEIDHTVTDLAVAYPEYPVQNSFSVISEAPPYDDHPLSKMGSSDVESEYGIEQYNPENAEAIKRKNPRVASVLEEEESPIYVAHDWDASIQAISNHEPEELMNKYDYLNW